MGYTLKNAAGSDVVYGEFRHNGNRAEYIGPDHDDLKKDILILTSVSPKQTRDSRGNRKGSANLVRTVPAPDLVEGQQVLKDMKLEISGSVPAGTSDEQVSEFAARLASLLADPAIVKEIFQVGKIFK